MQRRTTSTTIEDAWDVPTIGQLPGRPRCLQDSFRRCDRIRQPLQKVLQSFSTSIAQCLAVVSAHYCRFVLAAMDCICEGCELSLPKVHVTALRPQLQDHPRSAARSVAWYLALTSCSIDRKHDSSGCCLACLGKVSRLLASVFDACHEGAHLPRHGRTRAARLTLANEKSVLPNATAVRFSRPLCFIHLLPELVPPRLLLLSQSWKSWASAKVKVS